jgi:hypothetical protein
MSKVTQLGVPRPVVSLAYLIDTDNGTPGTGIVSDGSNGVHFGPVVQTITVDGAGPLLGPFVNMAAGSNITLTRDMPLGVGSNTVRIHSTGGGGITSNGSNSINNLVDGDDIYFTVSGSNLTIHSDVDRATILAVIDGGGSAITTGVKGDIVVDFGCVIEQWTMLADQSGSIVVDIWKDTYANYPPTDADSITGTATPAISSATKAQSGVLTGWTTTISAGDTIRYNVDSATTVTRVTVALKVRRT